MKQKVNRMVIQSMNHMQTRVVVHTYLRGTSTRCPTDPHASRGISQLSRF
jgi:hypothetical protein